MRHKYKYERQSLAVNKAWRDIRKIGDSTTRRPLQELKAQQVQNLCQSKAHSSKYSEDSKPITRKRALSKPPLRKLDLEHMRV